MTDEPNGHSAGDDNKLPKGWAMPEPVFRTSEGVTPKNRLKNDASEPVADPAEIATDPESLTPADPVEDPPEQETSERIKVIAAQPKTKKGGCASSIMAILLMIVIGLVAVLGVLVYLFYSTPPPDPFNN